MIYIQLFDHLIMRSVENNESKEVSFSAKPGCFVAYLLLNRNRFITKEELLETFWGDPSKANPNSALKTLVHRIRKHLEQSLGEQDYIIEENGYYGWNKAIDIEIDVEKFENNIQRAESEPMEDAEAIALYESTLEMYKDDFLSKSREYYWVDVHAGYYASLLVKGLENLISLYKKKKNYEKIEYVCDACAKRNLVDENIYYYQIVSKIFLNKREDARRTYDRSEKVLKKELGIDIPWKIESLREKVFTHEDMEQKALESVCDEIEEEALKGAFVCHYITFKEICRLEYRRMQRERFVEADGAKHRHILLLSAFECSKETEKDGDAISDELMNRIIDTIRGCLRTGDVISRCSGNQCVLLLYGCSDMDLMGISRRLTGKVKENIKDIYCEIQNKRISSEGFVV